MPMHYYGGDAKVVLDEPSSDDLRKQSWLQPKQPPPQHWHIAWRVLSFAVHRIVGWHPKTMIGACGALDDGEREVVKSLGMVGGHDSDVNSVVAVVGVDAYYDWCQSRVGSRAVACSLDIVELIGLLEAVVEKT